MAGGQGAREGRQLDVTLFGRQRRRPLRLELGYQHHVADIQAREQQTGEEGARVELHDRHAGGGAVEDEQHGWRDQDAQATTGGDRAGRQWRAVAGPQHGRQRQQAHQGDDGAHDAGGGRKHGAGDQRGHRQRARDASHGQVHAAKQRLDQVGALDQVAHEDE
jgi:hypothetical protein